LTRDRSERKPARRAQKSTVEGKINEQEAKELADEVSGQRMRMAVDSEYRSYREVEGEGEM